jgi:hypothetical protein
VSTYVEAYQHSLQLLVLFVVSLSHSFHGLMLCWFVKSKEKWVKLLWILRSNFGFSLAKAKPKKRNQNVNQKKSSMNKGNNALKSVTWKNNDVCFNGEKNSSENLSTRTQFFFLKRESLCVCVCACACVFLCVCFLTAKRNFCECTCVLEQAAVAAIS